MRRYNLSERELNRLVSRIIKEEDSETKRKKEVKPRCVPENVMPLDEIVGRAEEFGRYSPGITKRQSGVNSMVDTLGILNNIRLFKDVKDGGSHLAYEMIETTGECHKAMDKIIELYKENEHGTELVKDIERVLNLQVREDEYTPSPRAKEYLKQCLNLVKGQ